jgi:hypothetical protein
MTATENPFDSLREAIAFSSRDFAADKLDAWLYAIVCGWEGEAMAEVAEQHGWDAATIARLDRLHRAFPSAVSCQTRATDGTVPKLSNETN